MQSAILCIILSSSVILAHGASTKVTPGTVAQETPEPVTTVSRPVREVRHNKYMHDQVKSALSATRNYRESRVSHHFKDSGERLKRQIGVNTMTGMPYGAPPLVSSMMTLPVPVTPRPVLNPMTGYPYASYGDLNPAHFGEIILLNPNDFYDLDFLVPMTTTDLILPPNLRPFAVTPAFLLNYPASYPDFQLLCDEMNFSCFYYYYF